MASPETEFRTLRTPARALRGAGARASVAALAALLLGWPAGCTNFRDLGPPAQPPGDAGAPGDASDVIDAGGDASASAALHANAVAVGAYHACAIVEDGGVVCWGKNDRGEVGDGTTTDRPAPTRVVALPGPATSLALGGDHSCAVLEGGALVCWGSNGAGELGDSTRYDRHAPVRVSGIGAVTAAAADSRHTCAVLSTGGVMCWGANDNGELGAGASAPKTPSPTPLQVDGLTSGVMKLALGFGRSCVVLSDGSVRCWGLNDAGQIGDGTKTNRPSPVEILPSSARVGSVTVGWQHTCVLVGNAARCRGGNGLGQLGDGSFTDAWTWSDPMPWVSQLGADVAEVAASLYQTCARRSDGDGVTCWGGNDVGQLGSGVENMRAAPQAVEGLSGVVKSLAVGDGNGCAVMESGEVRCWGANDHGQLGAPSTDSCDGASGTTACSRESVAVGGVK